VGDLRESVIILLEFKGKIAFCILSVLFVFRFVFVLDLDWFHWSLSEFWAVLENWSPAISGSCVGFSSLLVAS
jgi:hypothetical protein